VSDSLKMVDEVSLIKKIKKVAEALKTAKDPATRNRTIQILKQSFDSIKDQLSPRTKEILTKSIESLIGEPLTPGPQPEPEEPIPWDEVMKIFLDIQADSDKIEKARKQCVDVFGAGKGTTMYNMFLVWLFYTPGVRSPLDLSKALTLLENITNILDEVIFKINNREPNYDARDVVRPLNYIFFKLIALKDKVASRYVLDFYNQRSPADGFFGDDYSSDIINIIRKDSLQEEDVIDIYRIYNKGIIYLQRTCLFPGLPDDPAVLEEAINRMKTLIKEAIEKKISSLAPNANEEEVKKQLYMLGKIADKLNIKLDGRIKMIVDTAKKDFQGPNKGTIKYAIMSDVHSNLQALSAVYADILSQNVDRIVFLGDLVGYGGNPNECVDKITGEIKPFVAIMGNHDDAAVTNKPYGFNPIAATAVRWTHETLNARAKTYLSSLLTQAEEGNLVFTHGCPGSRDDNIGRYISTDSTLGDFPTEATDNLQPKQIAFIGHTHHPMVFIQTVSGNNIIQEDDQLSGVVEFTHDKLDKAIINVGSVGQPRDHNPNACYVILTIKDNKYKIEFKRVPYNIKAAQKAIITYWKDYCTNNNLTKLVNDLRLATRLASGS